MGRGGGGKEGRREGRGGAGHDERGVAPQLQALQAKLEEEILLPELAAYFYDY